MQFVRAARAANKLNPGASPLTRKRFVLKNLAEHPAGLLGIDGFQTELQLIFMAFDLPGAGFNGSNPWIREVVDGEPEGVVEERVHRLVEDSQGEFGRFGGRNLRKRAQSFETDHRRIVADEFFKRR